MGRRVNKHIAHRVRSIWRCRLSLSLGVWVVGTVVLAVGATPVAGQPIRINPRGVQARQRGNVGRNADQAHTPVLIEPTAPIANLFSRAEDGIARQDWKFAIDSLQRIVDTPEGSLVERPDSGGNEVVRYESARRQALRRLASLPPEGLRAYRLLFDGKAKRLFEEGYAAHDPDRLRAIVDHYTLSSYGVAAADLLASWAIDGGRPGEAVKVLTDALELVSPEPAEGGGIALKLAVAFRLLGRTDDAQRVLESRRHAALHEATTDGEGPSGAAILALRATAAEHQADRRSWPVAGGSPARSGWMPAVEPTLSPNVPWRCRIPGTADDAWRSGLSGIEPTSDAPIRLPIGQLITDAPRGARLFARTREGCMALRAEDLSVEWISSPATVGYTGGGFVSSSLPPGRVQLVGEEPPTDAGIAFDDSIAGGISYAHGLVLIVSHEGKGDYTLAERDVGTGGLLAWLPRPELGRKVIEGSRLLAFDAMTGALLWQRGRTGHRDDPLGDVQFGAVPIAVGEGLWAPYVQGGDLRVAVIDPEDGRLMRSILLCSLGGAEVTLDAALPLASGYGLVFVPTDRGVVFAVDAADFSVRWASRYDDVLTAGAPVAGSAPLKRGGATRGWLPTPPMVSGGLVLLAPSGRHELLAFSAADGALQWSSRCAQCLYLISADSQHVWAGGTKLVCLSLSDGQAVWATSLDASPTGRAVRTGERISVPTLEGLLSLRAATGESVEVQPLPPSHGPLGNLLCLHSSMFSINPSFIQKFPDVGRLYPATRQQYESDPIDVSIALRLAWLELLRGRAQEAFDVLDGLSPEAVSRDTTQRDAVAHARVEALFALAEQSRKLGHGDRDVLRLLEEANATALCPEDRLRCGLAIADQLSGLGRHVDAFRRLWALGVSDDANQLMPWSDQVIGVARYLVSRRLGAILEEVRAREPQALHELAAETQSQVKRIAEASAATLDPTERIRRLRAIAALPVLPESGQEALLALAADQMRQQHYEQAEQVFRESLRLGAMESNKSVRTRRGAPSGPVPTESVPRARGGAGMSAPAIAKDGTPSDTAVASQIGLCRLYAVLWTKGYCSSAWLRHGLSVLESAYAGSPVPQSAVGALADAMEGDEGPPFTSQREGQTPTTSTPTVGQWVKAMRSRFLPDDAGRASRGGEEGGRRASFELTAERLWSVKGPPPGDGPRIVELSGLPSPIPMDRVLLHAPADALSCRRAEDGELLWEAPLRLPGEFPDESINRWEAYEDYPRRAVADGMTAVFAGRSGLFAVGLATGRRVWARPLSHEDFSASRRKETGEVPMAAESGLLAATMRPGRLTLMRMIDGSTVWERDLLGENIKRLWMHEGRLITAGPKLERVMVLDISDGHVAQRIGFTQPDPFNQLVDLILSNGLLYGPFSSADAEGVVAVDLATGQSVWRVEVDKPLVHLFTPQDGYLALGLLGGEVKIVRADSGELVLARRVAGAHAVMRGIMVDGTLIVQPLTAESGVRSTALVAFDVATDSQVWRRDDVVPLWRLDRPLTVIGSGIPVMFRDEEPQRSSQRRQPPTIRLGMVDVRTGEGDGQEVELAPPQLRRGVQLTGDFGFYSPGVGVIGTDDAIFALRAKRRERQSPGEF